MTPDERSLIQQLMSDPRCLETRLVYADMLEERGDEASNYLRLECQWFQRIADSPLTNDADVHGIIAELLRRSRDLPESFLATIAWRCSAVMLHWNDRKLNMVKIARSYTGGSLMETKILVESSPCLIKRLLTLPEAHKIYDEINHYGGKGLLVPAPLSPPLPSIGTVREKLRLRYNQA